MAWLRNPWGRPRFLPIVVGLYLIWSLIPVGIAILFAFNDRPLSLYGTARYETPGDGLRGEIGLRLALFTRQRQE